MWFAYSIFFAAWTSVAILISKKLIKNISPALFFIISSIFTLPFFVVLMLFLGIPTFSQDFFKLVFVAAVLDAIAAILYFKALSISEVSLISPISSFLPVFTLFFATFLLGEKPTSIKLIGVLIIVLGSYLLNISDLREGILKPFSKLLSDRGVRIFLIPILIWGLTPIFQKKAALETSPISYASVPFVELVLILIFLLPVLLRAKNYKNFVISNSKLLVFYGGMTALAQFAAMNAFVLSNVGYATAIFKLSTLFTVVLGAVFFHEKRIRERFLGAAVMVLGTILVAL